MKTQKIKRDAQATQKRGNLPEEERLFQLHGGEQRILHAC